MHLTRAPLMSKAPAEMPRSRRQRTQRARAGVGLMLLGQPDLYRTGKCRSRRLLRRTDRRQGVASTEVVCDARLSIGVS